MTEFIPLSDGDVHWAFPEPGDPGAVRQHLLTADAHLGRAATHLGLTGRGRLGFHRIEGITLAGVFAALTLPGVLFLASAHFPRRCPWDLRWGPPWLVGADIELLGAGRVEGSGGHPILAIEEVVTAPVEAAQALSAATAQLLGRVLASPPDFWWALPAPDILDTSDGPDAPTGGC
ncbi:hypothetical protein [Kitasatospora paranensis]|uniref:Uncharacterized protein n=1 Tax=Kitasatospora paranensis TaxID=258053 RepID=A0ABW2FZH7_9ACTN